MAIGIDAMAVSQATSKDIQAYCTAITTLKLAHIPVYPSGHVLLCDISTCVRRPLVPQEYRNIIITSGKVRNSEADL